MHKSIQWRWNICFLYLSPIQFYYFSCWKKWSTSLGGWGILGDFRHTLLSHFFHFTVIWASNFLLLQTEFITHHQTSTILNLQIQQEHDQRPQVESNWLPLTQHSELGRKEAMSIFSWPSRREFPKCTLFRTWPWWPYSIALEKRAS